MTKTAHRSTGQSRAKYPNRGWAAGPLTRMAHNQVPTGRRGGGIRAHQDGKGSGLGKTYPPENRGLQREIANRGLVLSQFWPDAPPQKHTFLMRNATMSGYGLATVVVEAGETSGARAQARMAVEHGRRVILTDQVVARNQWAQALVGRPGVHVAGSVAAVTEVVDQVVAMWDELRRLVRP